MKQRLLKSILLLCTLLVGSSVWGVDKVTDAANIEDGGHYFIGCTTSGTDYYLYVDPTTSAKGVKKTATADATEFIFTSGTGGGWYIQIASNGKYISLPNSKDNAKVNVQDDPDEWTATNVNSLIQLKINGFLLQGNSSSSLNFGSYASGQTNVWLLPKVNDTRAEPNLGFTETEVEASVGQEFTPPTLTAAGGFDGVVEYESSNPLVAQVMDTETGDLRIVSGGTTTITATFEGDKNFKPGSASYTLTVSDNRIATTISMDDIIIELADIASLTKLVPVVKDADGSEIEYTCGEFPCEVTFDYLFEDDPNGIIGSLDGNSGEITLNAVEGTVTVKAYYNLYGVNDTYKPSECTFTITVYQPLNGITEFCELENNASGTLKLTDAVVLYVNGRDMFVRDATGAVDFYNTSLDYKAGDVLNGMITAKFTSYYGMAELTTPISDNTLVATAGTAPEPTAITTDYVSYNACNLVKLTDVVVTSDNGKYYVGDVQVFNKFNLDYTLDDGRAYDIVGILIPYNTTYEICPTEAPVAGELVIDKKVTLPFEWNGGGKETLTSIEGVTADGLGSDYGSTNAPYLVKLDTNGDYIQVKTDCMPVIASVEVKMIGGGTTSYITVQESADGKQFTDVEKLTVSGKQNNVLYLQTGKAFAEDTRFVRFTFTKGSNVGLGGICIEKDLDEAVVGQEGYATYIAKHNVSFPEGVEAYIGVINKEYFTTTQVTAVPKGTPVILKNTGNFVLPAASADELSDVTSNDLIPAFEDVEADGTQYVLAKPEGQNVGFYQAESGKIAAGKAYLQSNAAVKAFYFEGEETTAITNVNGNGNVNNAAIYNIAGQRISKMQKGINIINGRKVLY